MSNRNSDAIRVLVADKAPLVRWGLRDLLSRDPRFRVVATVDNGLSFLDGIARHEVDIGVIGWDMPCADGRTILMALQIQPRAPRIVVYTGHPSPDVARQVMCLGGAGYCSKVRPPEELLETIAVVGEGRMVFPMMDVRTLSEDPLSALTEREREILEALSEGATNADLARRLDISVQTVKYHLKNVYSKVGVSNRAQAVALFLSHLE